MKVEKQDHWLKKIDHAHDQEPFGQDFSDLVIFYYGCFERKLNSKQY